MKRVWLIGLGSAVLAVVGFAALYGGGERLRTTTATAEHPAAPLSPAGPAVPSFDVVRVDPQGRTVMAGRAAPGAEVSVLDGNRELGRVTADAHGEWVFIPEKPLPSGDRALSLSARTPGEGKATKSDGVVALLVPEPESANGTSGTQSSGAVAVLLPRDGSSPARALQVPPAAPGTASSGSLALDIIQYGAAGDVTLSGRAQPNSHLDIYLDDRRVGSAITDAEGKWTAQIDQGTPAGRYRLRLESLGRDGKLVARLALPFELAQLPADAASGEFVTVQPGNSLWRIARRSYGSGLRYVAIYQANRSKIADPNVIHPGQLIAVPPGH